MKKSILVASLLAATMSSAFAQTAAEKAAAEKAAAEKAKSAGTLQMGTTHDIAAAKALGYSTVDQTATFDLGSLGTVTIPFTYLVAPGQKAPKMQIECYATALDGKRANDKFGLLLGDKHYIVCKGNFEVDPTKGYRFQIAAQNVPGKTGQVTILGGTDKSPRDIRSTSGGGNVQINHLIEVSGEYEFRIPVDTAGVKP